MSTQGELSGRGKRVYATSDRPERAADDWYVDEPWVSALLLQHEDFPQPIWDPACGMGNIVKSCEDHGLAVYGSDIVRRKRGFAERDFFVSSVPPIPWARPCRSIITNPPYSLAQRFVEHALSLPGIEKIAVLVQLKFLASQGRFDLFTGKDTPLTVYILSTRPSMPPGRLYQAGKIKAKGGTMDFCWVVFSHRRLPRMLPYPVIRWLKRDKP